jgi:hypothetical protein
VISGAHSGVAEDAGEVQGGEVGERAIDVSTDRTAFGFNPEDDVITHPQTWLHIPEDVNLRLASPPPQRHEGVRSIQYIVYLAHSMGDDFKNA